MFEVGIYTFLRRAVDYIYRKFTRENWVFGIILEVTSGERTAMKVDCGRVPARIGKVIAVHIAPDAVIAYGLAHLICEILAPCRSYEYLAGERGVASIMRGKSRHEVDETDRPVGIIRQVLFDFFY